MALQQPGFMVSASWWPPFTVWCWQSFNQTNHGTRIYTTNPEASSTGQKTILDTQMKNYEHLKINNANDEQGK